ncbi:hypothetical protein [Rhizorhabdus dicambivorans]|uniref:Periplasmic heavy metal sensor n=1 Tax=Rhizorhabdus dicambivorans TaxID=1850238 RepID=A0A2A4G3H8_9SPHN|nr:hypothetical protein [Rhizorhabdus dicambivorans]ATE65049.1 hypothetical protein CMV14_12060 [Rhizorhabdus dicambivorans]PCE44323.1 hypothetical protein COO09_01445 [Rhizorhabdus dicambivorans]
MKPGLTLLLLSLGLPGAAIAAPSPATPAAVAKPAAPASAPLMQGKRSIPLSAEGNAIAKQIIGTPDPRMAEIGAEMKTIREQKLQVINVANVDLDKLEQLFRREEVLQAEFVKRQNDRLLSLLRALPAADKMALLQNLTNPAKMPASSPAAPAKPATPAAKPAKAN